MMSSKVKHNWTKVFYIRNCKSLSKVIWDKVVLSTNFLTLIIYFVSLIKREKWKYLPQNNKKPWPHPPFSLTSFWKILTLSSPSHFLSSFSSPRSKHSPHLLHLLLPLKFQEPSIIIPHQPCKGYTF